MQATCSHSGVIKMFGLFKKDPRKVLEAAYRTKLEQAMHSQRNGDMATFASLSAAADELEKQLAALDAEDAKRR